MKKLKKGAVIFSIGGAGYGIIEVLWRGYTHWSMLVAGGMCFVIFSRIAKHFKRRSLIFKSVLCAISVTAVEGVFGFIFNVLLKENIWDYSHLPLNFKGQICLLYSFLWGLLGLVFVPLADFLNQNL